MYIIITINTGIIDKLTFNKNNFFKFIAVNYAGVLPYDCVIIYYTDPLILLK
jgi:hypothetical protein